MSAHLSLTEVKQATFAHAEPYGFDPNRKSSLLVPRLRPERPSALLI